MKYDELELLEFFESEPKIIEPLEAGMYIYNRSIELFKLSLYFSIYENECSVSIEYDDKTIVSADFKSIESIYKNKNCLTICTEAQKINIYYSNKNFSLFIEAK